MGFVGVVKFAAKYVDVLAWDLFALVYPLCASIQAIESGSSTDTSKLVAYWVLFSVLFLFEHALGKLLQWIPFWLYVKLLIFCWLVIPNFNGAFYAYKHLLRPCLYMDTKVLINQLKEKIEFFFKKIEFEAEVKKCLKENGPEAPEELVVRKVKVQRANFVQKDVKTVEVTERKDVSAVKKVYLTEREIAQTQNKNFAPKKIEETLKTVAYLAEFPEIPVSNHVQKWTCPLCQVTTESVTTRNSHLEEQQHKAALEKLKTKNQPSKKAVWEEVKAKNQPAKKAACEEVKAKNPPANKAAYEEVTAKNPPANKAAYEEVKAKNQPSKKAVWEEVKAKNPPAKKAACEEVEAKNQPAKEVAYEEAKAKNQPAKKAACEEVEAKNQPAKKVAYEEAKANNQPAKKAAYEEVKAQNQPSKTKVPPASEHKGSALPVQKPENSVSSSQKLQCQQENKYKCVEQRGLLCWCTICNVSCTCMQNMESHLKGSKHLAKVRQLNGGS